jgi:hypothetical protein
MLGVQCITFCHELFVFSKKTCYVRGKYLGIQDFIMLYFLEICQNITVDDAGFVFHDLMRLLGLVSSCVGI